MPSIRIAFLNALAGVVSLACGGSDSPTENGTAVPNIAGTWNWSATATSTTSPNISCTDQMTVLVVQQDTVLSATAVGDRVCVTPPPAPSPHGRTAMPASSGGFVEGKLSGRKVTLSDGQTWTYVGQLSSGLAPASLSGTVTGALVVQGVTHTLRGPWTMTR